MEEYEKIMKSVKDIAKSHIRFEEKLKRIAKLLEEKFSHFDWVGFYLVDDREKELILGPYVGESTEHRRIAFGDGVCGQVAEKRETFVIQDVDKEDNYLACSLKVKSEIVVPIFKEDKFIGELDIDSHEKGSISKSDRELLESIADVIGEIDQRVGLDER